MGVRSAYRKAPISFHTNCTNFFAGALKFSRISMHTRHLLSLKISPIKTSLAYQLHSALFLRFSPPLSAKNSCLVNISLQLARAQQKERRKFIRFGPAIAMADKRKKYFSLLASFVEMKWCKTRLAIVASSEINYSEHETLDKVSFYVYGDMKNCFGRTEVRGERFGVSFRLLPLKHHAACNSGVLFSLNEAP